MTDIERPGLSGVREHRHAERAIVHVQQPTGEREIRGRTALADNGWVHVVPEEGVAMSFSPYWVNAIEWTP
jgi:hypothetical protein